MRKDPMTVVQLQSALVAKIEEICAARTSEIAAAMLARLEPKKKRGRPRKEARGGLR